MPRNSWWKFVDEGRIFRVLPREQERLKSTRRTLLYLFVCYVPPFERIKDKTNKRFFGVSTNQLSCRRRKRGGKGDFNGAKIEENTRQTGNIERGEKGNNGEERKKNEKKNRHISLARNILQVSRFVA